MTDRARRNYEQLLPGRNSTLTVTDPEFFEVFHNFAFDEVLDHVGLDIRTRLMVQLASLVACQSLSQYRLFLGAAFQIGVTPVEVKEIVYQAVPYVGMAKAFDFIHATNETLTERGIQLPLAGQATTSREDREAKGRAVREVIAGADATGQAYAAAPADEIHFQHFLSANCFGDYVARSGISLGVRELLTFSMLVSLGGCEPQVRSHVAANVRVGNDRATLLSVVTALVPYIGYPRSLNALRAIDEGAPGGA